MRWGVLLLLGLGAGCAGSSGSAGSGPSGVAPSTPGASAQAVGPDDVLEISVFREPDLGGTYRVEPDGRLSFPLVGRVEVHGKTPGAVAKSIEAKLSDGYLKNPQVIVFVKEHNSRKIHVLGQVNKPGIFSFQAGMTVIHAVSLAGGFNKLASTNGVRVTRRTDDGEQKYKVAVGDIRKGDAPNFQLRAGDIVYVPEAMF